MRENRDGVPVFCVPESMLQKEKSVFLNRFVYLYTYFVELSLVLSELDMV